MKKTNLFITSLAIVLGMLVCIMPIRVESFSAAEVNIDEESTEKFIYDGIAYEFTIIDDDKADEAKGVKIHVSNDSTSAKDLLEAQKIKIEDIKTVKRMMVGKEEMNLSYDTNGDGDVRIVDVINIMNNYVANPINWITDGTDKMTIEQFCSVLKSYQKVGIVEFTVYYDRLVPPPIVPPISITTTEKITTPVITSATKPITTTEKVTTTTVATTTTKKITTITKPVTTTTQVTTTVTRPTTTTTTKPVVTTTIPVTTVTTPVTTPPVTTEDVIVITFPPFKEEGNPNDIQYLLDSCQDPISDEDYADLNQAVEDWTLESDEYHILYTEHETENVIVVPDTEYRDLFGISGSFQYISIENLESIYNMEELKLELGSDFESYMDNLKSYEHVLWREVSDQYIEDNIGLKVPVYQNKLVVPVTQDFNFPRWIIKVLTTQKEKDFAAIPNDPYGFLMDPWIYSDLRNTLQLFEIKNYKLLYLEKGDIIPDYSMIQLEFFAQGSTNFAAHYFVQVCPIGDVEKVLPGYTIYGHPNYMAWRPTIVDDYAYIGMDVNVADFTGKDYLIDWNYPWVLIPLDEDGNEINDVINDVIKK